MLSVPLRSAFTPIFIYGFVYASVSQTPVDDVQFEKGGRSEA